VKAYRLFTEAEARAICEGLKGKDWTAGKAASIVEKRNHEIEDSAVRAEILERVTSSPIPKMHFVEHICPPKLNRYRDGEEYGAHSDSAVMHGIRSDLACTLFLSDGYEGGELCVAGHEVKLSPGECIVYECWRPHWVNPVTKGERVAAIWWMQSYIRSEEQRDLLGMLRGVIAETEDGEHFAKLGALHEKLLKLWWS
jgi:PKHD-type hydroxylase